MMNRLLMIGFLVFTCLGAGESAKNVAIVKMVRGSASLQAGDTSAKVKQGMWIREGSMIKTEPRSFVRLGFVDKSTMNVGPSSQMKIEKFNKNEASVINVLSGKIRSQVSKDYLNIDKDKSKMFVKSKSAVMGIRGTDFIFSTHPKTGASTAVLFEGSVVFNNLKPGEGARDLESIVDRGRRINPGQFSVSRPDLKKPTVPAKMSSVQLKALEKNKSFLNQDNKSAKGPKKRSAVPPGLSGAVVASDGEGLSKGLEKVANVSATREPGSEKPDAQSKGFIKGADVKPVDGSIVHIDSGAVLPLGVDSSFDSNTQEWVSASFEVDTAGQIVVPEGYKLTDEGKLIKLGEAGPIEINTSIRPLDEVKPLDGIEPIVGPSPASDPDPSSPSDDDDDEPTDPLDPDSPGEPTAPLDPTEPEPMPRPPVTSPDTVIQQQNLPGTMPTGTSGTSSPVRVNVGRQ